MGNHFYYNNRFCPVNYVKNTTINLDTYENLKFNKQMLQDVNIDSNLKNTVVINNVSLTVSENMIYITKNPGKMKKTQLFIKKKQYFIKQQ